MAHFSPTKKTRFQKTPRGWLPRGVEINTLVNDWAERDDIVTYLGEGAGHGAPACFVPHLAEMEIDIDVAFGKNVDPRFVGNLNKRSIQFEYPVVSGAVLHEAMHAKHSRYDLLAVAKLPQFEAGLVTWFEETRIEMRGVTKYPKNRAFLRSCALHLVMGDLSEEKDFTKSGVVGLSQLILLTLARVDAGVLDKDDVAPIHEQATAFFGEDVLEQLRSIWQRAQAHTKDDEWEPQHKLALEWIKVLEDNGHDPKDGSEAANEILIMMMGDGDGSGGEGDEGDENEGGSGGMLAAMAEETESEAHDEAGEQAVKEAKEAAAEARKEGEKEATDNKNTAKQVYGAGTGPGRGSTNSRLIEERDPTPEERAAAITMGKALDKAKYRDRVVAKRKSVIPPGKLNSRAAVMGAVQRKRGDIITAEPWTSKRRFHTDDPDLKVGVLVDISSSMTRAMPIMASVAYIMSEATRRVQGSVSMVYYGNSVFPTLLPGQHLPKVKVYSAPDGTEEFDTAFKALDGQMQLLNGSGARLLVIVSDLYHTASNIEAVKKWTKRCQQEGVAVVVAPCGPDGDRHIDAHSDFAIGAQIVKGVRSAEDAAAAIGQAAIKALENASR